jgi:hypothetical protein
MALLASFHMLLMCASRMGRTLLTTRSALILLLLTGIVLVALLTSLHMLFMRSAAVVLVRHYILHCVNPRAESTGRLNDGSGFFLSNLI